MTDHMTREELLRRGVAGASILSIPGLLAACGGSSSSQSAATTTSAKQVPHNIHFSNWTLYLDIDEKTKTYPTLVKFEKHYGVNVKYTEDINDNPSFFAKIKPQLSSGESTGRDIIVMTDNSPYPALLVEKGWVEKLDKAAIPNIKNLRSSQRHPAWDPNREYSLPWQSGMTGIASNTSLTGKPLTSMDELLENPKYKGRVTLLNEMADTMTPVILANGDDPAKVTEQVFNAALNRIKKAVGSGQIRQFTGNDYSGPLAKGDLAAAVAWSGDVVQLNLDNPHLVWNVPDAGGEIWTDNMLIPNGGDVYTASLLMNWYYRPDIAAAVADYVNYISPVEGAKEVLQKSDPKAANNPLIFPPDETLNSVHVFEPSQLNNPDYLSKWNALVTA